MLQSFLRSREALWETDTSLQESAGRTDGSLNPVWLWLVGGGRLGPVLGGGKGWFPALHGLVLEFLNLSTVDLCG